jgi:lipoprotein
MAEFKGFAGGVSGGRDSPQQLKNCFNNGIFALSCGRIAEAYLYFLASDQKQCAVLYNIAVCFYMSENYEKALSYLDRALRLLPALPSKTVTVPEELERYEAQNDGYKAAMLFDTPVLYPERCRISILRLKADILFAMGNTEELKKVLPALSGGNYKNIDIIKKSLNKE